MTTNGDKRKHGNTHAAEKTKYSLDLYVTGNTARSIRSIRRLRKICEKHLKGRYELKVIDICQQPELASESQILAAPTLIKKLPLPLLRLVGDLSNQKRVSVALGLEPV
ncbi:MAG TPA: circadian clock KaiB family protein [Candidatus Acidoferrales bacterium]|nr:circadian clock KaiB family protein [Candidatus Acidoferrales bacterium]